jgi:hypothetical protein
LFPAHVLAAGINLNHGDASGHRAYKRAKIAANTLIFQNMWDMFQHNAVPQIAVWTLFHANALVRALFTGNVTKVATDTFLRIDFGDDFVIQIKIAPVLNARG